MHAQGASFRSTCMACRLWVVWVGGHGLGGVGALEARIGKNAALEELKEYHGGEGAALTNRNIGLHSNAA